MLASGKRRSLSKNSFLGLKRCDLAGLSLSQLLGSKQFLIYNILNINKYKIDLKCFADTGASGFLFIDHTFASRLSKALGSPILALPHRTPIRRFDEQQYIYMKKYIRLHLTINSRWFTNCPFIILDLGTQNIIIGVY